jgi:hypothetical protein
MAGYDTWQFELHKPGYFKRFVECSGPEDVRWLGDLAASVGVSMRRLQSFNAVVWPHYKLPDDNAQAALEIQLYFTGDPQVKAFTGRIQDKPDDALDALFSLRKK